MKRTIFVLLGAVIFLSMGCLAEGQLGPADTSDPSAVNAAVPPRVVPAAQRASVLVLPFAASEAGNREWIGKGIQQDLAIDLIRLSRLRVMAPADASAVQDAQAAVKAGREAGASFVIFGHFQVVDTTVRITGQVVETSGGQSIGALKTTGPTRELFNMEDSLADQALAPMPPQLVSPGPASSPPPAARGSAPPTSGYQYQVPNTPVQSVPTYSTDQPVQPYSDVGAYVAAPPVYSAPAPAYNYSGYSDAPGAYSTYAPSYYPYESYYPYYYDSYYPGYGFGFYGGYYHHDWDDHHGWGDHRGWSGNRYGNNTYGVARGYGAGQRSYVGTQRSYGYTGRGSVYGSATRGYARGGYSGSPRVSGGGRSSGFRSSGGGFRGGSGGGFHGGGGGGFHGGGGSHGGGGHR